MFFSRIVLLFISCLIPSYMLAEELSKMVEPSCMYQIELIAFEHKKPQKNREEWPLYPGELDLKDIQMLYNAEVLPMPPDTLTMVPSEEYKLDEVVKKITRSRDLRLVYHSAWLQPIEQGRANKTVYINSDGVVSYNAKDELAAAWEFEGTLSIKPVRNLFHTNVDFIYRKQNEQENIYQRNIKINIGDEQVMPPTGFRLSRHDRLKQKELYYFDHPFFGVFIMIMPVG